MTRSYKWDESARLKCLRDYLGLSVAEMAAALKVSVRSYQNFESGRAAIPVGVLDDVDDMVARLDDLVEEYATSDAVSIRGLSSFEMRAASIAAAAVPELRIQP